MWVMTFHAACARMLRADADGLGYTRQFTIYDAADQRSLIKQCLDELDVDAKRFTPRAMQSQISDAKNQLRSPRGLPPSSSAPTSSRPSPTSRSSTSASCTAPTRWTSTTCSCAPSSCSSASRRSATATPTDFRHILVDEYQDTNHAQYRWLQLLAAEHRNLTVVGDDDQCLVAGTPITMADGTTKPIEDVAGRRRGAVVPRQRRLPAARVTDAFESQRAMEVEITTTAGAGS